MNIFILDENPKQAAQALCDKHVVKQILESAQMLCHAGHKYGSPSNPPPYEDFPKQYQKHPCTLWTVASKQNYEWLCEHAMAICKEYSARYNKIHKSQGVIEWCMKNVPNLPEKGLTPFALAVKQKQYPDIIIPNDPVATYRKYYIIDKKSFAKWKQNKPDWYTNAE